jgi:hypothetical protein
MIFGDRGFIVSSLLTQFTFKSVFEVIFNKDNPSISAFSIGQS